jgi:hypothetical protein
MQAEPEAYAEFVEKLSALAMATTKRGLSTMTTGSRPTHKISLVGEVAAAPPEYEAEPDLEVYV